MKEKKTIRVVVTTKARHEAIEIRPDGRFHVAVRDAARHGVANRQVIALIAGYFSVAQSSVCIIRGSKTPHKTVTIYT